MSTNSQEKKQPRELGCFFLLLEFIKLEIDIIYINYTYWVIIFSIIFLERRRLKKNL